MENPCTVRASSFRAAPHVLWGKNLPGFTWAPPSPPATPPSPPPPPLTPNQTAILRPDRSKEQVRHSRMTFCSRAKQSNDTNWELQKGCVNFVTLAPEGRTEGGRRSDATQGTFPASCSAPPHSGAWCDITSPSVTFRTPRRERRTVARVDSKYSLLLHVLSVRAGGGGGGGGGGYRPRLPTS